MQEFKFKKGDRIKVIIAEPMDINYGINVGTTGTINEEDDVPYVIMDDEDLKVRWPIGYAIFEGCMELLPNS